MSDAAFSELLRSPLEPDPDQPERLPLWVIVLVGFVGGAVVGLAGGWWSGAPPAGADDAAATSVGPGTTVTSTVPPTPAGFAAGFVDAGRGVALRPMAVLRGDTSERLLVASAVRSDRSPDAVSPFAGMAWTLEFDQGPAPDRDVRSVEDPRTPGLIAVEFPSSSAAREFVAATVHWASDETVRSGCNGCGQFQTDQVSAGELIEAPVPYVSSELRRIDVGAALTLVVDRLEVAAEHGIVHWRIEGPAEVRVRVDAVVTFLGTDDPRSTGIVDETVLVAEHLAPLRFGAPLTGSPSFQREGVTRLVRVGEPIGGDNQADALEITWAVSWQAPVGDPIVLLLGGVPIEDVAAP